MAPTAMVLAVPPVEMSVTSSLEVPRMGDDEGVEPFESRWASELGQESVTSNRLVGYGLGISLLVLVVR